MWQLASMGIHRLKDDVHICKILQLARPVDSYCTRFRGMCSWACSVLSKGHLSNKVASEEGVRRAGGDTLPSSQPHKHKSVEPQTRLPPAQGSKRPVLFSDNIISYLHGFSCLKSSTWLPGTPPCGHELWARQEQRISAA